MSEAKWVIRSILLIYLTTTGIFLTIFFILWYEKLYEDLLITKSANLREANRNIVVSIINSRFKPINESAKSIAQSSLLKFAILNGKEVIFSNLSFDIQKADEELGGIDLHRRGIYQGKVFSVAPLQGRDYYINSRFSSKDQGQNPVKIIVEGENVSKELLLTRLKVCFGALFLLLLIGIISYFLVKIALKPLENKIKELNSFIKDSTHEINTPLSVILMSIERLEPQIKDEQRAKFVRMKLAAKTLAQIYSDLVFYNFSHTLSNEKEELNLKELLSERLEYFKLFFEQKKLTLELDLEVVYINANKSKISKMLDNLISNAIKYNKKGGFIRLSLKDKTLIIEDSGCGIEEKALKKIFDRYARFNKDQGGFGIGLALVQSICKEYKFKITCKSSLNEGSKFILTLN